MKTKKKFLSLLLSLAFLVTLLPTVALAADADYKIDGAEHDWSEHDEWSPYLYLGAGEMLELLADSGPDTIVYVWITGTDATIKGRTDVTYENLYIFTDNSPDIRLNIENFNTVAPKDPDYSGGGWTGIYFQSGTGTSVLNVSGNCSITGGDAAQLGLNGTYAVMAESNLTITGTGKLTAKAGSGYADGTAIRATDLTIDVETEVYSGETLDPIGGGNAAIQVTGDLTVEKKLTAYGAPNAACAAISVWGDVWIKAETTAIGSDSDGARDAGGGYGFIAGGNFTVDAPLTVRGGSSATKAGGVGIAAGSTTNTFAVNANLTATGGDGGTTGGTGAAAGNTTINSSTVVVCKGGEAADNYTNILAAGFQVQSLTMLGGSLAATGGNSTIAGSGGRGIQASDDVTISGGTLTATGGHGGGFGGHGIFSYSGDITIETGADVTAAGGNGGTTGGVGVRAYNTQYVVDTWLEYGKTVTIAADAGKVSVLGGMGASERRASIMADNVYIASGNVGSIIFEANAQNRELKNAANGEDVFMLTANISPAASTTITAVVTSAALGSYTYTAPTKNDGIAYLWLPEGTQTLSAGSAYSNKSATVASTNNETVTLTKKTGSSSSSGGSTAPSGPKIGNATGWSDVIKEVKKADSGASLTIDMNGTTTLNGDLLDAIADKDVTVVLDMGGGTSWTISGVNLAEKSGGWNDFNLSVMKGTAYIPATVVGIDGSVSEVQLRLGHNGEFGFTLILSVTLDKANAGYFANLFYYNNETGELEFIQAVKIGADGMVSFPFGHASDYLIAISETSMEPVAWQNPFADVKEADWFYGDVEYAVTNGLMNGTSDTMFAPNLELSRAMLVTILYRAAGSPEVEPMYAAHMMDVEQGSWYEDAMGWAVKEGIISGYGEGLYGPGDNVTREQLVTMLYRYAGEPKLSAGQLEFADASDVSDWAWDAIAWATTEGIISGKPGNLLDPQGTATRAETAAILHRFMEK